MIQQWDGFFTSLKPSASTESGVRIWSVASSSSLQADYVHLELSRYEAQHRRQRHAQRNASFGPFSSLSLRVLDRNPPFHLVIHLSCSLSACLMEPTTFVRAQSRATLASTATDEPPRQCETITRRGWYCAHADRLLGLAVKPSLLGEPGDAGLGLFTTRDREARTIVDKYLGDVMPTAAYNAQPSAFAVAISLGRVITAIHSNDCYARFCNDARDHRSATTTACCFPIVSTACTTQSRGTMEAAVAGCG